jgi:hypothetical protein
VVDEGSAGVTSSSAGAGNELLFASSTLEVSPINPGHGKTLAVPS